MTGREYTLVVFGWALCFVGVLLAALLFACGGGCPRATTTTTQPDEKPACPRR